LPAQENPEAEDEGEHIGGFVTENGDQSA